MFLSNRIWNLGNEFGEIMRKYDIARFDIDKKFTYINMVTPPVVADKKYYPKKWFVMFYFVVGTLFFGILAIVVIEQRRFLTSETNN